jgi:hypothetical protein
VQRREHPQMRPRAGAASQDVPCYYQLPFRVNMSFDILELQKWENLPN